ncbi:MAG: metallophosphoesterase [Planctomycetota bacterium]|nr:MAG: metallophosphoesterase [Planctomycetota bacterium]
MNARTSARTTESFTLAHLSDPHLSTPTGMRARDVMGKRILGYLSWRLHRRTEHRGEVLDALLADLAEQRPDHVVVTGDLTHIGLPDEYRQVRAWLHKLGAPSSVSVVPGNHDAYVRSAIPRSLDLWSEFMDSDLDASCRSEGSSDDAFPYLRVRGGVGLIGVSTARPSLPFLATGTIGPDQLRRLALLLAETREAGLCRVILIHHPTSRGETSARKGLVDSGEFRAVVAREGVELVLHGHTHRASWTTVPVPGGTAPSIGVPSSSAMGNGRGWRARYNLCSLRQAAEGWELTVTTRRFDGHEDRFVHESERTVVLPGRRSERPALTAPVA